MRRASSSTGVVGLGQMGSGLAISLARVGCSVVGFDEKTVAPPAEGVMIADDLETLGRQCALVLLALPDGPHVRSVVDRLVTVLESGSLIIDCSTLDPGETIALMELAAQHDVRFRDAGMAGGGPVQAAEGTLVFLVGCPENEWDEIRAVLAPIAREVVRCGDTSAGVTLKVINKLLALTIFLADVEAVVLARAAGLDVDTTLAMFGRTVAGNHALEVLVAGQLLPRSFEGAFRTTLAHKDALLGAGLAERLRVPLRVLAQTHEMFGEAVADGLGGLTVGAAGLMIERSANVSLAGGTS